MQVGLYVLLDGESRQRDGRLLTATMQPASDAAAQIELAERREAELEDMRRAHGSDSDSPGKEKPGRRASDG